MKGRAGVAVAALALIGVMALAVFPAKAWLDQRRDLRALATQDAALASENQALKARTDQLRSDEEIERLARQYNLVKPGEETYFIQPRTGTPPATASSPAAAPEPPPRPEPKKSRSLLDRITSIF